MLIGFLERKEKKRVSREGRGGERKGRGIEA